MITTKRASSREALRAGKKRRAAKRAAPDHHGSLREAMLRAADAGSSTVYVNPVRLRKSSEWRCRSARFSSGVISRGQLLPSHPGVAWICFTDEVHAS